MADDSVSLGLDVAEFKAGLAQAEQASQAGGARIGAGLRGATDHSEKLLRSSHSIARQLGNVSQAMVTGASAADVFAAGLDGVERSLNLPLGALAGLAVGAVLVEKLISIREEAKKTREEIRAMTMATSDARFESLDDLSKKLSQLEEKSKELNKSLANMSIGERYLRMFSDAWGITSKADRRYESQSLLGDKISTLSAIGEKAGQGPNISRTTRNQGEFAGQRAKLEKEYDEKRGDIIRKYSDAESNRLKIADKLLAAAKEQHDLDLEAIDKKEEEDRRELVLELKISDLQGDALAKAGQKLELEKQALNVSFQAATNDVQRGQLALQISQKEAQIREHNLEVSTKDLAIRRANLSAGQERGAKGELAAAHGELGIRQAEYNRLLNQPGDHEKEIAESNARLQEQKRKVSDLEVAELQKSPQQKESERQAEQRRKQGERIVLSRQADKERTAKANAETDFGEIFHGLPHAENGRPHAEEIAGAKKAEQQAQNIATQNVTTMIVGSIPSN